MASEAVTFATVTTKTVLPNGATTMVLVTVTETTAFTALTSIATFGSGIILASTSITSTSAPAISLDTSSIPTPSTSLPSSSGTQSSAPISAATVTVTAPATSTPQSGPKPSLVGAILLGILIPLFVAAVIVGWFLLRRRKRNSDAQDETAPSEATDHRYHARLQQITGRVFGAANGGDGKEKDVQPTDRSATELPAEDLPPRYEPGGSRTVQSKP